LTDTSILSRPARLAARLTRSSEEELEHLFMRKRILIRLEDGFASVPDSRETFFLAVNQCLRFCPNVSVYGPNSERALIGECGKLSQRIHGPQSKLVAVASDDVSDFDAVLNVGRKVAGDRPWITVNSAGWVARLAVSNSGADTLFWESQPQNPVGAIAAASLGVGAVFLQIIGQPPKGPVEFSLFSHESATPGTLGTGPQLPSSPLTLRAFLVGCGAVTNGWAYTIKRLPVIGELQAIDNQALRTWNLGTYVAVDRQGVQEPKVGLIRALLSPQITVTPRAEEWELFKIRLGYGGISCPDIIVNGLDNVDARHSVQRLWPDTLIDMAAGGLTSQVIVSQRKRGGLCLLRGLVRPPDEMTWAERLSRKTGLHMERILNEPTTPITQEDIDRSCPEYRAELERVRGHLICGHVTRQNLEMEGADTDFAPAVPFVTTWSGVVGAAETLKWLMGYRNSSSLHYQKSFQSGRVRALEMICDPQCECHRGGNRRVGSTQSRQMRLGTE
jgi:hypothetical protein